MTSATTSETTSATMPAAFIGHGSPMNTLEHNRYTEAWHRFGRQIEAVGRPRAILSISAHWYINATAVTAMDRPRVIHDFYGFPDELATFDYPAPGAPDVAREVAEVAQPVWVGLDQDSWGLDHGTWSVLTHVFPDAAVPVVQLSIDATKPFDYHVDLGRRLAPLLDDGVAIVGSGNVVHNLGRISWGAEERGEGWAERYDARARELMADDPGTIAALGEHPDHHLASPTPDHLLPLFYVAGIAAARAVTPEVLVGGCTMGSLSMTSWSVTPS